ncbi:MAG: exo-alpha-sialidase [Verrucomicrobia bacterium]|nr:exo-alpha-sialidase [Verrucomicrobiota bacterium]
MDSDSDGLTDAFEVLSSKTSPATNHTYSAELTDLEWWLRSNILVNDPEQDCGNEQNSQFETTVVVLGSYVVVAWVDSNQGVYALGQNDDLANYTPRMVGYAVSHDGGVTFEDRSVPPLAREGNPTDDDGDAGDPVLAADRASGVVYLVGTSPRNEGHKGIPHWKSGEGGVTFGSPTIVRDDILQSDKPWLAVDDWPGTGQHDVYLMCTGRTNGSAAGLWLTVSTDGVGGSWTNPPLAARMTAGTEPTAVNSPIILVASNHTAYVFWFESTGPFPYYTNWLKMRQVLNRGAVLGEVQIICRLESTNNSNGNLELKSSNAAADDDTFRVFPFPVPAINPVKTNHLYMAYADRGTNSGDKADVFFVCSTNGGTNWTNPVRVNTDSTMNDQWMPVLCVKPDGTQLFMAWYDRRNDTNNSLMELYGCFGTIATNGLVNFGEEFVISTTGFPPVFAGTLEDNKQDGRYDPVYPPGGVNLHWHYAEWPEPLPPPLEHVYDTFPAYIGHVGEYNGVWAADQYLVSDVDRLPAGVRWDAVCEKSRRHPICSAQLAAIAIPSDL